MQQRVPFITTLLVLVPVVSAVVTLRPVSTIYLPYSYNEGEGLYGIDEGASEQTGYDSTNKIAYSGGKWLCFSISYNYFEIVYSFKSNFISSSYALKV